MPLPLILGIGAAAAGAAGLGTGIHGTAKLFKARGTMKAADVRHKKNLERFEQENQGTIACMDRLGKLELDILKSFERFSAAFEKIQGRPQFRPYSKGEVTIPEYNGEELKRVSVGAGVLLGGLGGAALGAASGFAAAGATTSAVMTLGVASTGTAIASLHGVAAVNATLAAIGGGSLAAGGGGIALGTTILSAATFGVGLLVGGIVFSVTGNAISDKADQAEAQVEKAEKEINVICAYLEKLRGAAEAYEKALSSVNGIYQRHLDMLTYIVNVMKRTDWNDFSEDQRLMTENAALLVGLLYNMCKVQLVLASGNETELNRVNTQAVEKSLADAQTFLDERGLTGAF